MRTIAVMPAYNAELTLEQTVRDIPPGSVDEIILGDDGSTDGTVEIAKRLGLTVIGNSVNMGYGANQKLCYTEALKRGADIVIMIHPDYQYDSRLTPYLTGFIKDDICDIILGSRIRTREEALAGGMPRYKYFGNRFLTLVENVVLGQNLAEFHSGFRAFSRKVLETIPFMKNSDGFVFDSEILIQAVYFNFRTGDVPVPTKYFEEASSIDLKNSIVYGIRTLVTLGKYVLQKGRLADFGMFHPKIS
ncbi:MAG: glycosyltransferase family 2 protein [Candidatus Tritonobacter lacicola]|nr:glycosyltransferase family 2 protein [Candidatus Tritonobacter lacicola]